MKSQPLIRQTLQCGRCRNLITNSSEAVVVKIGDYPPRRLCDDCAQHVQLECCTPPRIEYALPLDATPATR